MGRDVFGFSDFVFEIMTESLGPLKFRRISKTYATKIEKADFQNDLPPEAFLSLLIVILGVKSDGSTISVEESYALSQPEREAFAEAFINEHKEFWREMAIQEVVNEQGQKIIQNVFGEQISNPRHSGEELIPYVTRLYRDFNKGIITRENRNMEPQRKLIEERSNTLTTEEKDLLLKNASLSESLGRTLAQMKALEGVIQTNPLAARSGQIPPSLPPAANLASAPPISTTPVVSPAHMPMTGMPVSPPGMPPSFVPSPLMPSSSTQVMVPPTTLEPVVHAPRAMTPLSEATERMNEVLARIDAVEPMAVETLGMMKSLNDASVRILADFSAAAEKNARSARRATRVAILAFLIALLVPAAPYLIEFYKQQQPGYAAAKRAEEARAAQAIADQKAQIDTLKATVEELRAQRAARPRPFAD